MPPSCDFGPQGQAWVVKLWTPGTSLGRETGCPYLPEYFGVVACLSWDRRHISAMFSEFCRVSFLTCVDDEVFIITGLCCAAVHEMMMSACLLTPCAVVCALACQVEL